MLEEEATRSCSPTMDGLDTESALLDSTIRIKARSVLYKKAVKPLIEKKRRTRMNASLDQLKELLQDEKLQQGQSLSRLEKADVLELAVKEFQRMKRSRPGTFEFSQEFSAGYSLCQNTVSTFLNRVNTIDPRQKSQLLNHIDLSKLEHFPTPLVPQGGGSVNIHSTAPQIWTPHDSMVLPYQTRVPEHYEYMGYEPISTDQCVPSPQLWAWSSSTFPMALPAENFPRFTHGTFDGYNSGAHHQAPGLVESPALYTSMHSNSEYSLFHEGELYPPYFPIDRTKPASITWGFGYPLQHPIAPPAPDACLDFPPDQPTAPVEYRREQEATTTLLQIWRPW